QPELIQRVAGVDADRKRLRRDLEIERPSIAGGHLVEPRRPIRDDASEDVQAARRALRIAAAADAGGQTQLLDQRNEIHGPALQGRPALEREAIDHELTLPAVSGIEPASHGLVERQEAGAQLIRHGSKAEIEAGGLELRLRERDRRGDPALRHGSAQCLVRQHTRDDVVHAGHTGRLTAPRVSTSSDRAAPDTPACASASSIARPTVLASASPRTTASSEGPAPPSTQPRGPDA